MREEQSHTRLYSGRRFWWQVGSSACNLDYFSLFFPSKQCQELECPCIICNSLFTILESMHYVLAVATNPMTERGYDAVHHCCGFQEGGV